MAKRFANINDIEWIGFDPSPFAENIIGEEKQEIFSEVKRKYTLEFEMLVATASYLKTDLQKKNDLWAGSPFEWLLQSPARQKGALGGRLVASWCASKGLSTDRSKGTSENLIINGNKLAIKFSTLWDNGKYNFQQIRKEGCDYVLCFGISPNQAHCWVLDIDYAISHAKPQHKSEYWLSFSPENQPEWLNGCGGSLDEAYQVLKNMKNRTHE